MKEETKEPTKENVIAFFKEQIEVAEYRNTLSRINCETAEYEARRAEAIAKQAHFSKPLTSADQNIVPHVVTQEDLNNNPELAKQGIKVGDTVGIASHPTQEESILEKQSRKL
jgi:hypothetical protein